MNGELDNENMSQKSVYASFFFEKKLTLSDASTSSDRHMNIYRNNDVSNVRSSELTI